MTDEIKWDGKDAGHSAATEETRLYTPTQANPQLRLTEEAWGFLTAEVTRRQRQDQAAIARDAFAAAALQGILASGESFEYGRIGTVMIWEIADAMMDARK